MITETDPCQWRGKDTSRTNIQIEASVRRENPQECVFCFWSFHNWAQKKAQSCYGPTVILQLSLLYTKRFLVSCPVVTGLSLTHLFYPQQPPKSSFPSPTWILELRLVNSMWSAAFVWRSAFLNCRPTQWQPYQQWIPYEREPLYMQYQQCSEQQLGPLWMGWCCGTARWGCHCRLPSASATPYPIAAISCHCSGRLIRKGGGGARRERETEGREGREGGREERMAGRRRDRKGESVWERAHRRIAVVPRTRQPAPGPFRPAG